MAQLTLSDGLRPAGPDDWPLLGDITADAFQDDPVSSWAFGGAAAKSAVFRSMARHIYTRQGICHIAEAGGATMWLPPGASGTIPLLHQGLLAARVFKASGLGAIQRTLKLDSLMTKHHPKFPHYYLFTIGVLAKNRGTGLGKKLMAPVLEQADRDGVPVYLENSNPANTGFYMSHGFVSQQIFHVTRDAPPLEAMLRPPKSA